MPRAIRNGAVVGETPCAAAVEDNHRSPSDALHRECFTDSTAASPRPWYGGKARCPTPRAAGKTGTDATCHHPEPLPAAGRVADRAAFRHGGVVEEEPEDRA